MQTQQGTAPGSTFKMVTSTAGLAEGVISTTEQILDRGEYENISNHPKCWIYPSSHGSINVSEATVIPVTISFMKWDTGFLLPIILPATMPILYLKDTGICQHVWSG